jgi:hypothetical protein
MAQYSYMNSFLRVKLDANDGQHARLVALQAAFAEVCNALAPVVMQTRVWNRVALHHMAYRSLRERFPAVGSQMVCNAIYSVSRTCRLLFQSHNSPLNIARDPKRPLPLLRFTEACPVYFDRHTLSLKDGQVSMFTLDGRMRFQLAVDSSGERMFSERRLLEIVLMRRQQEFELHFLFAEGGVGDMPSRFRSLPASDGYADDDGTSQTPAEAFAPSVLRIPDYLKLEEAV